jgi:hypothetical protein
MFPSVAMFDNNRDDDTETILDRDGSNSDQLHEVLQMRREGSEESANHPRRLTRAQDKKNGRWRCHVITTFLLGLTVLLMATAVAYNPFRSAWRETVVVAKIMAPVGTGSRCHSPCVFFTSQYLSPVEAFFYDEESSDADFADGNHSHDDHDGDADCPLLDAKIGNRARLQGVAVGAPEVELFFSCPTRMPFNIIGVNATRRAVNIHPKMLAGVFRDLRIDAVYLAYVGLPALLAKGHTVSEALRQVLDVAKVTKETVRFPQVSSIDLVEAAAVQLLCAVDADEVEIAVGMGCNKTFGRH